METTRRKLLTLLSSIPALGVLGAVGGTKAEAKDSVWPNNKDVFVNRLVRERKYKNGCTDVTELPSPYPFTAWDKIEWNILSTHLANPKPTRTMEYKDVLALNKKIVEAHPSLFPTERTMTAPTCKINGQGVSTESKYMKAEYTLEFAQDLKGIYGLEAEEELRNILADQMALELYRLDDKLMDDGYGICPYIPVQMIRAIDPDTFQPKIRVLTQYGVMKL